MYLFFKTLIDFIFAFVVIVLGFPFFLLIALLIKFSSRGPIFYDHLRVGKNFKKFKCKKFRTMHPEADDILKNLLEKNIKIRKEFQDTQKIKNDPRITTIGKFLRKTILDELPQFINVLKMEMSVIGPRPIVEDEIPRYTSSIQKVVSIKPGITGLWQVEGRSTLSYVDRKKLDLYYAKNISLKLDLYIFFKTIFVLIFPKNKGAF